MILRRGTGALLLSLASFLFAGTSPASAQEMVVGNDAGVGGRAMGMGGAYIAVSDDASAIWYNPAGLAQIRRIEWNLGISVLKAGERSTLASRLSTPAAGAADGRKTVSSISSFGGVLPLPTYRGSLVFAAAYNRIKEFDSLFRVSGYSDTWDGTLDGRSDDSGGLDQWSLAGAVDVSPAVSLGLSLDYRKGDHTLDQKRSYWDDTVNWAELYHSGYSDNIRAWSFQGGMLVRAANNLRFGATLRLPLTYTIRSSYFSDLYIREDRPFTLDEHPSSAYADSGNYTGSDRYKVKVPMQLGAGLSWAWRGVTLSGDLSYLDWSQSSSDLSEPEYRYRNTLNWRVGAELPVPVIQGFIRAGYASAPDPYTGYIDTGGMVTVNELNRRDFITLGAGILLDPSMMLDVAFLHGFWSRESDPRTDESTRNKLFLTPSYRM